MVCIMLKLCFHRDYSPVTLGHRPAGGAGTHQQIQKPPAVSSGWRHARFPALQAEARPVPGHVSWQLRALHQGCSVGPPRRWEPITWPEPRDG